MNVEKEIERITNFLKEFLEKNGYKGATIGISGGIDSATVAALLRKILPKERIRALILPERDSNPQSVSDARLVCEKFGLDCTLRSISPILRKMGIYSLQPPALLASYKVKERYALQKWKEKGGSEGFIKDVSEEGDAEFRKGVAYYRAKHRVRMCVLYMEAEMRGYAVVGTTNRTEWLTGLYVKWGDDATDVEPLLHLYKTEVFELAKALGVPERILEKAPTPDLIPGLTDEMALGMSYKEIDEILSKMEKGEDTSEFDPEKVEKVKRLLEAGKRRNLRMVHLDR